MFVSYLDFYIQYICHSKLPLDKKQKQINHHCFHFNSKKARNFLLIVLDKSVILINSFMNMSHIFKQI